MRRFFRLLFAGFLCFLCAHAVAQEKIISGTVRDADNDNPIPGVSVLIKGTNRGTQANMEGAFTIRAQKGDVLIISSVGYSVYQVKVTDATKTVAVKLKSSQNEMGEVIVTAMDIRRNSRELGYSAQSIGGTEVAQTQRENFLNSLQGRIAGLSITPTNGQAGASSNIVLRGFNSLTLSNQPLFVVDGIILDNSTMNETSNGGSGLGLASDRPNRQNDYSNRISDLNPADIESITVLKGPEATALYGSQASSGAIVITTRKAQPGKVSLQYDNSFRAQAVIRFEDVNNDFSPGTNGAPGNTFTYFGPAYPSDTKRYDNIHHFFRTGFAQTHNLSADMGTKNAGFRVSGSYFNQQGVVPNNDYKKFNVRITNTTKIGKYIDIMPSVQYINTTTDKPLRGAGGYLLGLYLWPVDNDVRVYEDENGNKKVLYAADPNAETDNPFFNVNKNHSQDKTERYVATLGVNINPFSWLSIAGRFGYDHYKSHGYTFYHPSSSYYSAATGGYLDNYWRKYYGYNHTITATAKKTFGHFSTRLMVGTMWQDYDTRMFAVAGSRLKDSVSTDSSNTSPNTRVRLARNAVGEWNKSINRQIAYFGEVGLSFKNYLFLSYTHRFEASSIFPSKNRHYEYPGISMSAIVTDMIPGISKKVLNYAKLRASMANTARVSDPYMNQSVFVDNFASAPHRIYSYGYYNNNPDLEPEIQTTYELGTELRFLDGLFSLDAAYYNTLCEKQIVQGYRGSYATGFVLNTQNAASTRNQGVELVLNLSPIRRGDFTWNMRYNFNHMWSKVLSLPAAINYEFYIADTWIYANARGGLIRDQPTTTITGYHYERNDKGDILINPTNGLPVVKQTFDIIGDRNPDFTLGAWNGFRYKNWSLSFLWDIKAGGDIFNATEMYLTIQGKSARTADRKTPRVVKGILKDGLQNTDNPTVNNIVVVPYYTNAYYQATTSMPEEEYVQKDVNWFRLRDITVSYNCTPAVLSKLKGFKSLSFFVTGNDLLLFTNYRGVDPAVNGNTASANGVGGIGFDYGNLPTTIGINVGIRAGF